MLLLVSGWTIVCCRYSEDVIQEILGCWKKENKRLLLFDLDCGVIASLAA